MFFLPKKISQSFGFILKQEVDLFRYGESSPVAYTYLMAADRDDEARSIH